MGETTTCVVCGKGSEKQICELCGNLDQIRMVCATCGRIEIWELEAVKKLKEICAESGYTSDIPERPGITIRFNACCVPGKKLRLTVFDVKRLFN